MSACQAIEFRRPLKSSGILEAAHEYVRNFVQFASEDRIFADDIRQLHAIIHDFSFCRALQWAGTDEGYRAECGLRCRFWDLNVNKSPATGRLKHFTMSTLTTNRYDPVRYKTPTGTTLNVRAGPGSALRMLLNNLDPEVAERPEELIVYGGGARPPVTSKRWTSSSRR